MLRMLARSIWQPWQSCEKPFPISYNLPSFTFFGTAKDRTVSKPHRSQLFELYSVVCAARNAWLPRTGFKNQQENPSHVAAAPYNVVNGSSTRAHQPARKRPVVIVKPVEYHKAEIKHITQRHVQRLTSNFSCIATCLLPLSTKCSHE